MARGCSHENPPTALIAFATLRVLPSPAPRVTRLNHLDRTLQRQILEALAESYPAIATCAAVQLDADDRRWLVNVHYLAEHGLVELPARRARAKAEQDAARITAKGIDFLQDDGGLGAILGVLTVKFEADTLRALLLRQLDQSELASTVKDRIRKVLVDAGADTLKDAAKALIEQAWRNAPQAVQALESLLRS